MPTRATLGDDIGRLDVAMPRDHPVIDRMGPAANRALVGRKRPVDLPGGCAPSSASSGGAPPSPSADGEARRGFGV